MDVKKPLIKKFLLFLISSYTILELRTCIMSSLGNVVPGKTAYDQSHDLSYINRASAIADEVVGYRYKDGVTRVARIYNNEVIYDNTMYANAQGYRSSSRFTEKKSPGVYRIVVLGDSFTSGSYLINPWPSSANTQLEKMGKKIEIYNFALDGAGTGNWHSIYFNEILPKYEFDALVIATSGSSLSADFFIQHSFEDGLYISFYSEKPKSKTELNEVYLPKLKKVTSLATDTEINQAITRASGFKWNMTELKPFIATFLIEWTTQNFAWAYNGIKSRIENRFLKNLPERKIAQLQNPSIKQEISANNDIKQYLRQSFSGRIERVFEIIEDAKKRDKRVLLSPLPERESWKVMKTRHEDVVIQKIFRNLAAHYQIEYFDGFESLQSPDIDSALNNLWLKYDRHWNNQGSDMYAVAFAKYLLKEH